jgi:hypothetical protein
LLELLILVAAAVAVMKKGNQLQWLLLVVLGLSLLLIQALNVVLAVQLLL